MAPPQQLRPRGVGSFTGAGGERSRGEVAAGTAVQVPKKFLSSQPIRRRSQYFRYRISSDQVAPTKSDSGDEETSLASTGKPGVNAAAASAIGWLSGLEKSRGSGFATIDSSFGTLPMGLGAGLFGGDGKAFAPVETTICIRVSSPYDSKV